jgi:aerotaxis receptor
MSGEYMRANLPVTGVEYDFPASDMLVSATNISSHIEYCNPAFIEVSGYSRDELIGQPHNLIRHPDMPKEAFEDMWRTIQGRQSWTALVKNRRKNGDHYWVRANVTPIIKDDSVIGYLSVRTKPNRAEVVSMELLYKRLSDGHARQIRLRAGRVEHMGLLRVVDLWRNAGLSMRVAVVSAMGSLLVAVPCAVLVGSNGTALISASLVTSFLGAWLPSVVITKRAGNRLAEVERLAARMAAGDLTIDIPEGRSACVRGTLRSLAQLRATLIAIVSDVRSQIECVKVASREVAIGNMDLSKRTEVQAASLQETAASLEQLTATVKSNSQATTQANDMMSQAQLATKGGCDAVSQTKSTMQSIATSSAQIADIVTTIDSIAFQTNILALNAAVESARAGEAGKGFAVVAAEVRGLAQRCATSARQIKGIVDTNSSAAAAARESVALAADKMLEIESKMQRVSAIVQEIASASVEQSLGIDGINDAVLHLDDATQQNAALVEQGAATAENLAGQASVLDEAVRLFTLPSMLA